MCEPATDCLDRRQRDVCAALWADGSSCTGLHPNLLFGQLYLYSLYLYWTVRWEAERGRREDSSLCNCSEAPLASFIPTAMSEKKHQLKYAGTETFAYCTMCVLFLWKWPEMSQVWAGVSGFFKTTPRFYLQCVFFLMSGVGLNLENDGVVSVFYSINKFKKKISL